MSIGPQLLSYHVSMSYFVKNYVVLMTYFKSSQTAWIHKYDCACPVETEFNLNRDLFTELISYWGFN